MQREKEKLAKLLVVYIILWGFREYNRPKENNLDFKKLSNSISKGYL